MFFNILFFYLTSLLAQGTSPVTPFNDSGRIIHPYLFFQSIAQRIPMDSLRLKQERLTAKAFVTKTGVFSFIEHPLNHDALKDIAQGSYVKIRGQQFVPGNLILIESLKKIREVKNLPLSELEQSQGKFVELKGFNVCQCGLNLGSLPRTCSLGHFHHLQAVDGKTYHYFQQREGIPLFLGAAPGYHYKNVSLTGELYPGNFIWVENAEIIP